MQLKFDVVPRCTLYIGRFAVLVIIIIIIIAWAGPTCKPKSTAKANSQQKRNTK